MDSKSDANSDLLVEDQDVNVELTARSGVQFAPDHHIVNSESDFERRDTNKAATYTYAEWKESMKLK